MKRTSVCHKYKTFIALAVSGVHKRIDSIHISLNEIHTGSKKELASISVTKSQSLQKSCLAKKNI